MFLYLQTVNKIERPCGAIIKTKKRKPPEKPVVIPSASLNNSITVPEEFLKTEIIKDIGKEIEKQKKNALENPFCATDAKNLLFPDFPKKVLSFECSNECSFQNPTQEYFPSCIGPICKECNKLLQSYTKSFRNQNATLNVPSYENGKLLENMKVQLKILKDIRKKEGFHCTSFKRGSKRKSINSGQEVNSNETDEQFGVLKSPSPRGGGKSTQESGQTITKPKYKRRIKKPRPAVYGSEEITCYALPAAEKQRILKNRSILYENLRDYWDKDEEQYQDTIENFPISEFCKDVKVEEYIFLTPKIINRNLKRKRELFDNANSKYCFPPKAKIQRLL